MQEIEASIGIEADAAAVWTLVGDPARIADWVPALAKSRIDGDLRHIEFIDGGSGTERVLERDDIRRTYTYEYLEGPLPLENYRSTISVTGDGDLSSVSWKARFGAATRPAEEELAIAIQDMYQSSLAELKSSFEG
ncbi:SRPBCC family protein [Rhodococcus erythropolis]|uniref:SRPBCC family protein n=1 Tax=Rhodococcus erythropolis TaxID=1833 RepID=UPI0037F62FAD